MAYFYSYRCSVLFIISGILSQLWQAIPGLAFFPKKVQLEVDLMHMGHQCLSYHRSPPLVE